MNQSIDRPLVVLTGAGVSAESGVPTFRGKEGLWRNYTPQQLATPESFRRDPELVWRWYAWRRELIATCKPNPAHETLAQMERVLQELTLITQNVDGLHQAAGSQHVLELHGNIWRLSCTQCGRMEEDRHIPLPDLPPHCTVCDGLLRPDVICFGESLPRDVLESAWDAAARASTMLVVGTSAVVEPAASLPLVALRRGAYLVEVNPRETPLSRHAHQVLRQPAGEVLPRWWEARCR